MGLFHRRGKERSAENERDEPEWPYPLPSNEEELRDFIRAYVERVQEEHDPPPPGTSETVTRI